MSSTSAGGNRAGTGADLRQIMINNAQIKTDKNKEAAQAPKPKTEQAEKKQSLKTEKQEILKRNSIVREGTDRSKLDRTTRQQTITKKSARGESLEQQRVNHKREEDDPLYVTKRGRKTAAGLWNEERWGLISSLSDGDLPAVAKVEKGFHDLRVLEQGVIGMRKQAGMPKVHGGVASVDEEGKVLYKPAAPIKDTTQISAGQISELYAQTIGAELGLKTMPWQLV